MTPTVTVVVAAHNADGTIKEAMDSILNQSFQDWEMIVVDDASTDGTSRILDAYGEDPRIHIVRNNRNLGSGASRNLALNLAKGKYILVQDADDVSRPNRMQLLLDEFVRDSNLGAVSGQLAEFGTWGGPVSSNWPTALNEIEDRRRRGQMPLAHPAAMFRRDLAIEAGGYDEACRRAQDYALFMRLRGWGMACVPEIVLNYRTVRPLPVSYVLLNGRYAQLARRRLRAQETGKRLPQLPRHLPASVLLDLRSLVTWLRRRLREKP
jgi:teichuronic acid biosynthesis glycosyltransferase TuaG